MAQVHVVLHGISNRSDLGSVMPALDARTIETQLMTSGATSAVSTIQADRTANRYWTITARSGDVWIKFGTNPTAESGKGWLLQSGHILSFAVGEVGEKVAILNA